MSNSIKPNLRIEIIPLILIFATIISSVYFFTVLPEEVPVHWNLQGEVDRTGSKIFHVVFFPLLVLGMYLMFLLIPYLDPKKERYEQFKKIYHVFKNTFVAFMSLVFFLTSLNALGYNLPIEKYMPIFVGILFVIIGNYLSKIKPNWFMGIRTPWTLSSEENWRRTHQMGGKIFILSGIIFVSIPFLPIEWRGWLMGASIALAVIGTIGYSLYTYLTIDKKNEKNQQSEQSKN